MTTLSPTAPAAPSTLDRAFLIERAVACLEAIRARKPFVLAITNTVAQHFTANGLLAIGAVPCMARNAEEIEAFVESADAVLLNLGTMSAPEFETMRLAASACGRAGKPFVLDPVFAERSPKRLALARDLLRAGPAIAKFNAGEAAAMGEDVRPATAALLTGAHDRLSHENRHAILANGHPLLGQITATGCLLGAILAAGLAVERDPFLAAVAGASILNITAEVAAPRSRGPGSFAIELMDALAALDRRTIETRFRLEEYRTDAPR